MNTVKVCDRGVPFHFRATLAEMPQRGHGMGEISLNVKVIPSVNHRVSIRILRRR